MLDNNIPYGAQYYRTPNPPQKDWERDLREMKAQGMNTVRLWAMWSWIHKPGDEFDFSHLDRLMDLCNEIGLNALIQVILENAPAWLVSAHQECRYVTNDGQPIQPMGRPNTPGGGWPGLCQDNPKAWNVASKFIHALGEHFAGHPALLGYDIWNEVWFELHGYIGEHYYCYCDATVYEFRKWLCDRYIDLEGLNNAWYRRYTDWSEVVPPRYWGGYPDWLDWIKFRLENQGRLLQNRVDAMREADPNALIVSHGLPTTLEATATHLTDDWRNAEKVDLYGLSCFPHWFKYQNVDTFKVHDTIRCASRGKIFWTAETQAGPSGEGLMHSKTPLPEDIRLWNWISLAAGAKGLLYWQWRPELLGPESPGFGLTHLDGTPNERTKAASAFPKLAAEHRELRESKPLRGEVAILALPESQIFCHAAEKNAGKYAQSVRGAYRALSEAGYQVDFARIDQIENYPLIYLPFPLMIESASAKKIAEYVKNGGYIISEACPALFGDGGYTQVTNPGYGLHEVFGVRAPSGPETVGDNPPSFKWNEKTLWCVVHRQSFNADSAEVLASYADGGPAITEHAFGAGRAILIGTYPGIAYEWGQHDAAKTVIGLATFLGVTPRSHTSTSDVWVRLHRFEKSLVAYVVNLSSERRSVRVHLSPRVAAFEHVTNILSDEDVVLEFNAFNLDIDGHDAAVLKLRYACGETEVSAVGREPDIELERKK